MKKTLAIVAGLFAMVASADDSYLYWMVDDEYTSGYTWDEAKLFAVDSSWEKSAPLDEYSAWDGTTPLGTSVSAADATLVGAFADVSAYLDNYSYYIELYNEGNVVAHSSSALPYSLWKGGDFSTEAPAFASSFAAGAVPEPTSGLLVLLGGALLGLRRRRVVA